MRFLFFGVMAAALLQGCAPSSGYTKCEAVCEDANACDLSGRSIDVDCPEFCSDARRVHAAGADCAGLLEAHLDCWQSNVSNICDPEFTGCQESNDAWVACLATFCEANESDPSCISTRSGPVPALSGF